MLGIPSSSSSPAMNSASALVVGAGDLDERALGVLRLDLARPVR